MSGAEFLILLVILAMGMLILRRDWSVHVPAAAPLFVVPRATAITELPNWTRARRLAAMANPAQRAPPTFCARWKAVGRRAVGD